MPLGRILVAHGLRGEVLFRPYNPGSDLPRPGMDTVLRGRADRVFDLRVAAVRRTPKGLLVRFEGLGSRTDAEALRGAELGVPRSALPPVGEGEYYWADVVGAPARVDGVGEVGRVTSVFRAATDVLVVEMRDREVLVPVVAGFVIDIGPGGVLLSRLALEDLP